MKIQCVNELVQKLGMDDPTTFFYQFIYDKNYSDDTNIIQYFIMHICFMHGHSVIIQQLQ